MTENEWNPEIIAKLDRENLVLGECIDKVSNDLRVLNNTVDRVLARIKALEDGIPAPADDGAEDWHAIAEYAWEHAPIGAGRAMWHDLDADVRFTHALVLKTGFKHAIALGLADPPGARRWMDAVLAYRQNITEYLGAEDEATAEIISESEQMLSGEDKDALAAHDAPRAPENDHE